MTDARGHTIIKRLIANIWTLDHERERTSYGYTNVTNMTNFNTPQLNTKFSYD
jgi:hypothetical protein